MSDIPEEAIEAACVAHWSKRQWDGFNENTRRVYRRSMSDSLTAAAPFIRAQGEREHRASALEDAVVMMGGVGAHRPPCRLPDTSCLCGVCDDRAEAMQALRDRAAVERGANR